MLTLPLFGSKPVLLFCVIIVLIAIVIQSMIIMANTSEQTLFSLSTFNICMPLSLVYTCLAHCWVFVVYGNNTNKIQNPLPTPLMPSPQAAGSNGDTGDDNNKRKVAIITGSNTGIGFETAKTLAIDYGWEVILACRSRDKAIRAMEIINKESNEKYDNDNQKTQKQFDNEYKRGGHAVVIDQPLDLSDFDSVRKFAKAIQDKYPRVDALINNAGMNTSGKSNNGLDLLFQSNFLGHFLLTNCLIDDNILKGGKVINLSSVMHHFAGTRRKDLEFWKYVSTYSNSSDPPPESYTASKLAMIYFSQELNRRYRDSHDIYSIAVNPGSVASDIWRGFPAWLQTIFRYVYLTTKQGSTPAVAATVQNHHVWKKGGKGETVYLQPYWIPNNPNKPMIPFTEMLGPYVGYVETKPRLPSNGGDIEEAKALWEASEEIILKS